MAEKLLELELNNNHSLKGYPIQSKILIFQIKCLKCNCIIDKTDIKMYKHKRETLQTDWLHAFFLQRLSKKEKTLWINDNDPKICWSAMKATQ